MVFQPASGVILAGGASRRMGRDKAWIELDGHALVERVLERLRQVCQEIIIVTENQEPYRRLEARVVGDSFPGKGSLGGISTGLNEARFERAIAVSCDLPFLNPALLDYMLSLSAGYEVVIPSAPRWRGRESSRDDRPKDSGRILPTAKENDLHPLHAVYSKNCLGPIRARIAAGDLRMIGFYPEVRVRLVTKAEVERFDPDYLSFFNVNTPEELEYAEELAAEERTTSHD